MSNFDNSFFTANKHEDHKENKKSYTFGIHPVLELIAQSGFLPGDKIFTARKTDDPRLKNFFYKAKKSSVVIEEKNFLQLDTLIKNISAFALTSEEKKKPKRHQGLVLERQNHLSLPQISEQEILQNCLEQKFRLYLVADGVSDPQNLGAMARSALAFQVEALLSGQKNSAPLGLTALKASAGSLSKLPVCRLKSLASFLRAAKENNAYIIGAAMQGTYLNARWAKGIVSLRKSLFLVMGSEEKGISANVEELCDEIVVIRQSPQIQSLNVSVSSGILLQAFYAATADRVAKTD